MENKKLITVEASMENLDKITSFVEAFLDDYACPMKIAMKILLCVGYRYKSSKLIEDVQRWNDIL